MSRQSPRSFQRVTGAPLAYLHPIFAGGQAEVKLTWSFQARLWRSLPGFMGAWRRPQAFGIFLMTSHYFVKGSSHLQISENAYRYLFVFQAWGTPFKNNNILTGFKLDIRVDREEGVSSFLMSLDLLLGYGNVTLITVKIFAKVPYHQHYYSTTLDVWTRRVAGWIGLSIMVIEAMGVLWEGWLHRRCFENVQEMY